MASVLTLIDSDNINNYFGQKQRRRTSRACLRSLTPGVSELPHGDARKVATTATGSRHHAVLLRVVTFTDVRALETGSLTRRCHSAEFGFSGVVIMHARGAPPLREQDLQRRRRYLVKP